MRKTKKIRIDFCRPAKDNHEIVANFERLFAKKIGVKYCVAVNSGYSALFLALWVLGIRKGDEVIVPNFTMIATANAVKACGAKPVFAEVESDTGNISTESVARLITKKTRAIIPVHIYGQPCEMDPIMDLARKNGLKVVEDAAEAHGARYKSKYVGSIGHIGCFSFYANKIISTGEGGIIATNTRSLADKARKFRSYCFQKGYWHSKIGWSFRMNPYGAREGIKQMLTFASLVNRRREIANFYNNNLTDQVIKPIEKNYTKNVYWMYGIKTEEKRKLAECLKNKGIETRDFFVPMTAQPMYRRTDYRKTKAWKLYKTGLLLPSMPDLTKKEQEYICQTINNYTKSTRELRPLSRAGSRARH